MHVAPVDLRALRQGGIGLRFAMLGQMAYVFAEIPASGSAGTSLEQRVLAAPLGLRHRRRADVRRRRPARDHPGRPGLPRPGRWSRALVRGTRACPGRRLRADRTRRRPERRTARGPGFRRRRSGRRRDRDGGAGHRDPEGPRRPDPDRDLADGVLPHDPGPDGGAERLHVRLVRRPALGPGHRGSNGHRVGGRRRDPLDGRHLPLPGRTARTSAGGRRSGDIRGSDAGRRPSATPGDWRIGAATWISAAGSIRAGSRWPRSSEPRLGQPGKAPRPSPASGSDRS